MACLTDNEAVKFLHWTRWALPWIALGLAAASLLLLLEDRRTGTPSPAAPSPETAPPGLAVPPGPAASEPGASAGDGPANGDYTAAVERSAPAVVNIFTERVVRLPNAQNLPRGLAPFMGEMWGAYQERVERSLGSGVIYDDSGHVVTNYHVVASATQVSVQLRDGRDLPARLVGSDRDTDLAVLQVEGTGLPVVPLGRSDRLRVGEPVLAIGNPLGLGQTVTQGIVSATGRGRLGVSTFESFIQTDAAINFGNSGGALVNGQGELVGINTAVIARNAGIEGIGFAIPVDLARGVVDAILRDGRVIRGWIGIRPQALKAEEARQFGYPEGSVIVTGVYRGAPAASEGMRPGDVITELDGKAVNGAEDLLARIASTAPGGSLMVTVRRGPPFEARTREYVRKIPVIERPAEAASSS